MIIIQKIIKLYIEEFKKINRICREYLKLYDKEKENKKEEENKMSNADKRIFSRTAVKTKKININPKPRRGGIRF